MIRRIVIACALILGVPVACAGPTTGVTTTTAATVQTNPPQCTSLDVSCVNDSDCCSLWCVSGSCERREP